MSPRTNVGGYVVEAQIGEGGFGTYQHTDELIDAFRKARDFAW